MSDYLVPLKRPEPNAEEFIATIRGEVIPRRVPMVEYIVDDALMQPIVTEMMGREWVTPAKGDATERSRPLSSSHARRWDNFIEFWYRMGYPYVRLETSLPFPSRRIPVPDTAEGVNKNRHWMDQHEGMIKDWESFEKYPWPTVDEFDFRPFEYIAAHLPDGLGFIANHGGGPLEHLTSLFSYEGLSLALYDDPALVKAVADRVGGLTEGFYKRLLEIDNLTAIFPGDDMGFRTGTLISPDHMREYVLPWHRRYAEMAHEKGLPYFLHSCGNVESIMEDLIEEVGIDAKHSFEDAIMPVSEAYEKYSKRIGILGGVDIDVLTRSSEEDLRAYVRGILGKCAPGGRFAFGSGNSIPSYIPVRNYLAMLDEGLRYRV